LCFNFFVHLNFVGFVVIGWNEKKKSGRVLDCGFFKFSLDRFKSSFGSEKGFGLKKT